MNGKKLHDGRRLVYVDGFKIRNFIDDDFGIIHGHSKSLSGFAPKFYIPENEIWLDWRYADELEFLYKGMVFEPPAHINSTDKMRSVMKNKLCFQGPIPKIAVKKKKNGNLTIVMVDGKNVR